MRSPRWASRTRSRTRHDAGLAQNLRRAAGFPGRLYSTHVRSVPAIRFLEEGSHNVKMKPLISREDDGQDTGDGKWVLKRLSDSIDGVHQLGNSLQSEELTLNRDKGGVGGE